MSEDGMRICRRCGQSRPLSEYYCIGKRKDGASRYASQCKECKRAYYRANRDRYFARAQGVRERRTQSDCQCAAPGCDDTVLPKEEYCLRHQAQIRRHGRILPRTKFDPNDIIVRGDIAEIVLRDRKQKISGRAIIDAVDLAKVADIHWHRKGRCVQGLNPTTRRWTTLSRFLMEPPAGKVVMYVNHDCLDNRRANLKVCTRAAVAVSRRAGAKSISGVKGVTWSRSRQRWHVSLVKDGKHHWGGAYEDLQDAVEARRRLESELLS